MVVENNYTDVVSILHGGQQTVSIVHLHKLVFKIIKWFPNGDEVRIFPVHNLCVLFPIKFCNLTKERK
jgi:hypothetical protein